MDGKAKPNGEPRSEADTCEIWVGLTLPSYKLRKIAAEDGTFLV